MPAKNSRKVYADDGIYHVYNRGVEKRIIFEDEQDYSVFLKYLKDCLTLPPKNSDIKTKFIINGGQFIGIKRQPKNYHDKLELLVYCLMPNHFHFIIKVGKGDTLKNFMQSLLTRYSMYFNKKYKRVGSLFQGRYKAILIDNESYLLHLSRYIHLNPSEYSKNLTTAFSSYSEYLGIRKTDWVKPKLILSYFNQVIIPDFKKTNSYKDFVEKRKDKNNTSEISEFDLLEDPL